MAVSVYLLAALVAGTVLMAGLGWRVFVGVVAGRPVSAGLRQAAGLRGSDPRAEDFVVLVCLCMAAGAVLRPTHANHLIRCYYQGLRAIGACLPRLTAWAEREMTVCSRYVAAQIDRCVVHNSAYTHRIQYL